MVDLYSHILLGVENGEKDYEESLKMVKVAVEQGTYTIVATPHHLNNVYENSITSIVDRVVE
jgi:protein-tyrosine phosphatase